MSLPKIKVKKLIKEKEFVRNAKKVKESIEEQIKFLYEKKLKNGDRISSNIHSLS